MNKILKYNIQLFAALCFMFVYTSCDLDYENTKAINPDNVWKNKDMISAFLTDIYGECLPGWPLTHGEESDEGLGSGGKNMKDYLRGLIDVDKTGKKFDYSKIEKVNFFLENLASVPENILTENEKNQMTGQALFWRAWNYWNMVKEVGGVPLILKPQDPTNKESLFMPRNKTSECVEQIIKDLDDAISVLYDKWDDSNYGRIDKGAAMAFKGRILLWYASPLFNPSQDKKRWDDAYKANDDAVKYLKTQGKGLYPDYGELWYDERNEEVVMVNQFFYPDHAYNPNGVRPEIISKDAADGDQPYFPLVMAYPKRDGSPLELDINKLSDNAYNQKFMSDFYDRDDRFYATIFYGGGIYPTPDFDAGIRFWKVWMYAEGEENVLVSMARKQFNREVYVNTGYNQLKAIDRKDNKEHLGEAGKDWVEIRFAEVLMNFGECANEVGKSDEALQVLYDIRKRAGITAGTGKYGITASSQSEIREAYITERQVEFAFEGKRLGDLRRWKRYDIMNAHVYRAGLAPLLINNADLENFDWTSDMRDPEVQKKFRMHYVPNLDRDDAYKFNLSENHWFYPVHRDAIDKNSKTEQNNEWGGTFDPLL